MAAEDDGVITAAIRLSLKELEKDAVQAQKTVDNLANGFRAAGEQSGAQFAGGTKEGLADIKSHLNDLKNDYTAALAEITEATQKETEERKKMTDAEAANAQAEATAAYIEELEKLRDTVAEITGEHSKQTQAYDALLAKQKETLDYQKGMAAEHERLGESGGKMYVKGFGKGQKDINNKLNDFVGTMKNISPKMGGIGDKMAKVFSKPIFKMVPAVSQAFQAMLPFIGTVLVAVGALMKGVSSALEKQKAYVGNIKLAKQAQDILKGSTTGLTAAQQKSADITARQEKSTAVLRLAFQKLSDFFENTFMPVINTVRGAFATVVEFFAGAAAQLGAVSEAEAEAAVNAQKLAKENQDLADSTKSYKTAIKEIEEQERAGIITAAEAYEKKLAAVESNTNALIQLRVATEAVVGATAKETLAYDGAIREQALYAQQLKATVDAEKKRTEQTAKTSVQVRNADTERIRLMKQYEEGLRKIAAQYITDEKRAATDAQRAEARLKKEEAIRSLAASTHTELQAVAAEFNVAIERTTKFKKAVEDLAEAMETLTDPNEGKSLMELFLSSEEFEKSMTIANAALGAFDQISGSILDVSRRHAEEQIAIIDKALEKLTGQIEAARQAELEAQGFIEAQSEEEFDKQIEAAQKAGDEVLQYQISRRKQELEINKRYDAQVKEAEEKAAREKADIAFRLAKEEYAIQMINAVNTGIQTVLDAYKRGIEIPFAGITLAPIFAGLAGAASAVQIGLLAANPPKRPQFASGGIVPGRKSDGDAQHIIATAGELILTEAQQHTIAGKLEKGGETVIHLALYLDGASEQALAAAVFRVANDTGDVLEKRSIRGLR
jgi:hypothetical protein